MADYIRTTSVYSPLTFNDIVIGVVVTAVTIIVVVVIRVGIIGIACQKVDDRTWM